MSCVYMYVFFADIFVVLIFLAELASVVSSRAKRSADLSDQVDNKTEEVYFIRIRAFDKENNSAPWSNIVTASFLKPEEFEHPVGHSVLQKGIFGTTCALMM